MTRTAVLATFVAALMVNVTFADEPGWTDEERAARSVAVFDGRVVSVKRVDAINDHVELHNAVISVETVFKGKELVDNDKITVYFERPVSGDVGKRCPAYVELKQARRAKFFVRTRKDEGHLRAYLDMGSDVKEATPEASPILSSEFSLNDSKEAVEAARKQGAATAEKDIKAGKLRILCYGKLLPVGLFPTDKETGYPVQVVPGCIVSGTFVAEVDAYNRAMREWAIKQTSSDESKRP
jgi:hypothetical protein